ncbi:MAG TPA: helix-turn-helix domain-containing protein [Bacteroidetes bacterium]|nr:helix-turn-helix domain-containing protein [Bacteroidota bacterium]
MAFVQQLNLLIRLHYLIKRKATGTPDELAKRLSISRSALYNYIEVLRDLGAQITYCRSRQTFHYYEEFELSF